VGGEGGNIQNLQISVLNLPSIQEISQHKVRATVKFDTGCQEVLIEEKEERAVTLLNI